MVFSGLFLPILVGLGVWQLERAQEKKTQLAQWQQEADNLSWPRRQIENLKPGQPVKLSGRYGKASWLLDNRTREGAPGYEVLTIFLPDEGRPVVVNRGWLQAPRRREQLPEITEPAGQVELSGRLSEFPQPPLLKKVPDTDSNWPKRVQSLSHQRAQQVEPDVVGLVLRLDGPEQPGAYRADWAPDRMGPQTHYGYALQWFSLAAVLVILTVVASYRKTGAKDDHDNG